MNIKLLKAVKRAIQQEPKRLDMNIWVGSTKDFPFPGHMRLACGTVACIAGWALLLHRRKGRQPIQEVRDKIGTVQDAARKVLRISPLQERALFYDENWPEGLDDEFWRARTAKQRAKIACKRIDLFIRDGK